MITSERRRRHWSRADKERIVAAAMQPGATILSVARAFGVHSSQVFRWRQQLRGKEALPGFAAVTIAADPHAAAARTQGLIEVEIGTETRTRISGPADVATVTAVASALRAGS
ncbi:IS66-like element accessory protein TnpA [Bradyrhizobium sp. SZCCHNRI1009]|uniref:IS66-like element accessory protein TnpA n=1 Tax=Bradyrhizobium sp. SZCCHNRI1009 TaxID=3057277 RepID=UPI0029164415|nr:transposase [Bradyrhizobium sp. SZCCHNRI1009]